MIAHDLAAEQIGNMIARRREERLSLIGGQLEGRHRHPHFDIWSLRGECGSRLALSRLFAKQFKEVANQGFVAEDASVEVA